MEEDKRLEYIANYYGFDEQSRQCVEEMAELTKEICKYHRADTFNGRVSAMQRIRDEIADVEIMIKQLKLFINPAEVESIAEYKIERQLKRIEKEKIKKALA